jgi:hypothetical protein
MNFNLLKFLFLFAGFSLLLTDVTDADLIDKKNISQNQFSASTLDFANTNTINNQKQDLLFNINGIDPGGFSVNSFRIKNTGQSNLKYQINFQFNHGDIDFCQSLELKLMQNNQIKYQGKLTELKLEMSNINSVDQNDWVAFVSLSSSDNSLKDKICNFNLNIYGWQPNQPQNLGFNYQQSFTNNISSGD